MNCRHAWTPVEDQILISFVKKYGVGNWTIISQKMEARANANSRSGKQCRQRWHNHLDPKVQKKSWTLQEQKVMFEAHKKYGNKWTDIANQLNGRTDSDVKNHFYSIIRKCLRRLSKMVGQKNSTEKIRNVKPTLLSKLLEGNNDSKSRETSDALFKFILQRENLNFKNLEKKTRDILQNLVENIVKMSESKDEPVKSFFSDHDSSQQKEKKVKKIQNYLILISSMEIQTEKEISNPSSSRYEKKVPKAKKIKKNPPPKSKQRESKISTSGKQNIKNNLSTSFEGIDIEIPKTIKHPSFRLDSIISEHHSEGFRQFETGYALRKRSSNSRDSILSDRGLFHEIQIPQISHSRRSSANFDNRRMMSTTENFVSFCKTPQMPTPGYGGNLFQTFSKQLNTGSLTLGELNSQVDILRKTIRRNNQQPEE